MARFYEPDVALAYLGENRERLSVATRGRSDEELARSPDAPEWSPLQILAHLRACAELWGGNIHSLVNDDVASIRTTDPRDWLESVDLVSEGFAMSLRRFRSQRSRLLGVLDSLSEAVFHLASAPGGATDTVRSWPIQVT